MKVPQSFSVMQSLGLSLTGFSIILTYMGDSEQVSNEYLDIFRACGGETCESSVNELLISLLIVHSKVNYVLLFTLHKNAVLY